MSTQEEWMEASADTSVTTEVLDNEIKLFRELDHAYQEVKKIEKLEREKVDKQKAKVMDLLSKAGKQKYYVEGIGTAYFINKMSVQTPKTIEEKKAFFDYIKSKYGDDVFMDKVGMHSATLNRFYNEIMDEAKDNGEDISTLKIPGISDPVAHITLGFRKEKA
jgi:hypothetical protein